MSEPNDAPPASLSNLRPPPRQFTAYTVRVRLLGTGEAVIESKCGRLRMTISASTVRKRFGPRESHAYFRAELDQHGILELGDRLPGEVAAW